MKQETVVAILCLVTGFLLGHYLYRPHFELHDNVILNTYTGEVTSTQEQWKKEHPNEH